MVHNTTRVAKFPFSNAVMASHTGKVSGSGMGSVLLQTGGPGAGSSYRDIDDYISTTGINPYTRASKKTEGSGLSSIASKLSKLNIESPSVGKLPKRKNITMSL